jgi:pilus assembly protein Flp/PilA
MLKLAKKFWNDEQGLELSEYAIMIGLIAVTVIAIVTTLGGQISGIFTELSTKLSAAPGGAPQ